MRRGFLVPLVLAMAVCFIHHSAQAQQVTTGSIEGTVSSPQGTPLAGASVTITSRQGSKTVTTDASGRYTFPYLTPGVYNLSATLQGYNTVQREKIDVALGATVRIEVTLSPGVKEEISVVATSPEVDLNTATSGANITSQMMEKAPIGRTFANALPMAPGVNPSGIDQSNPSISGASGLENNYMINGVNVSNTGYGSLGSYSNIFGSLGTGVNFDYIQEVQVKTGGYEPEFGEALGGYVNLITKSGGNEVHGSVLAYYQAHGLQATAVRSRLENATFDPVSFDSKDVGFEVGGPVVKDKAFWYLAFDPTFSQRVRQTSLAVQKANGFSHELTTDRTIYNYAGDLKWQVTPNHVLTFSAFGDPAVGQNGPQRVEALALADPTFRYSSLKYGGNNAVARWQGQLMPNWLAEGQVAYHTDRFEEEPGSKANSPNGIDRRPHVIAPGDTSDVPRRYGGLGFFENAHSKNIQYGLKLSNFLRAAGEHNIKYGVDYEDIKFDHQALYSGNPAESPMLPDSVGGALTITPTTGYSWDINATGTRFRINRIRSGSTSVDTKAHYTAAFLYDDWNVLKNLHLMAGIRWEQEKLLGNLETVTFGNNWAPRLHMTWDPANDNKTKVAAAYGRFFGKVPNDLAVRALSSEITYVVSYPLSAVDLTDPNHPVIKDPTAATSIFSFGDTPTRVAPGSKLTYEDEWLASVDRQIAPSFTMGATYLHRKLGRTLEDTQDISYSAILHGADFGEYVIRNPNPPDFPKPSREYDAVTVRADKRLAQSWQILASYTWSRLKGNYEGYFRRDNGQSDPFITSLFDFPYLKDPDVWAHTSEIGFLPNDRTHVFNAFGSHQFDFGLALGASLKIQSGTPITKLGFNEVYGNEDEIVLETRGASGRTPTTYDLGLHADYGFNVGGGRKVEAIVNVFNVLNQQKPVDVVQTYELGGTVNPPASISDVVDPCPTCVNPDFGKPIDFQPPRSIQVALRTKF